MTKNDALNLYNGLQNVSNLKGAKWAYAIARNVEKLRPEVEALRKAYTMSEEFADYEGKRLELARKHSVKEKGTPKTVKIGQTEEYLIADKDKFNQEIAKLQKKYNKAIVERKKQLEDFNEILEEKVEMDLHMIDSDYIPEEITPEQVSAIMPIIREKEDKVLTSPESN